MSERAAAEEHLRVIRSLMERSTIYRAISAPTALVAGITSMLAGAGLIQADLAGRSDGTLFLWTWLSVLVITLLTNFGFIWRAARDRQEAFASSGMRMAFRAVLPAFLCGAAVTIAANQHPAILPPYWILFYGLGLLATGHFAPRSIAWLGWAFVAAGISLWFVPWPAMGIFWPTTQPLAWGSLEMACTFGLFHFVYALFTFPRHSTPSEPDPA